MLSNKQQPNVMTKQLVIFSDLDGTLLDHHTYKIDPALEVIAQLKARDIPIVLNTSKTKAEVLVICDEQKFGSPFIIENGAAVFIPVGYFKEMPEDCVKEGDYWCKSFCHERKHWLDLLDCHAHQFDGEYKGFSQLSNAQLCELTGLSPESAALALDRDFSEPIHWLGDADSKANFIGHMSDLGAKILQGGRFMHVSGYCDKGQAQQWLLEQYRIDKQKEFESEQVEMVSIALGDSDNDSAMLEAATFAVQIKTPVHDYPVLQRTNNVYQTKEFGPAGWAESLTKLVLAD